MKQAGNLACPWYQRFLSRVLVDAFRPISHRSMPRADNYKNLTESAKVKSLWHQLSKYKWSSWNSGNNKRGKKFLCQRRPFKQNKGQGNLCGVIFLDAVWPVNIYLEDQVIYRICDTKSLGNHID